MQSKPWSFRELKKALFYISPCKSPATVSVNISSAVRSGSPIISVIMKEPDDFVSGSTKSDQVPSDEEKSSNYVLLYDEMVLLSQNKQLKVTKQQRYATIAL